MLFCKFNKAIVFNYGHIETSGEARNMSARPTAPRLQPSKDRKRMSSVVSTGMALRQLTLEHDLVETRDALFALQIEAETQARERAYEEAHMRVRARSATSGSLVSQMEAKMQARQRADVEARMQAMRTILVDMDNTIAEFDGGVIEKYTVNHPEQTWWIKGATNKEWGIADDAPPTHKDEVKELFSAGGFITSLQPIEGAVEALNEMIEAGFNVRLCTSPLTNAPMGAGEKIKWAGAKLGKEWKKRVIITSDKTLVKGSMLIDDKMSISGFINPPEWEHVLFGRPYMNYHQNEINGRRTLHHWAKWRDLFTSEMLERVIVYAPPPSTSS